jgi:hypothetical protein
MLSVAVVSSNLSLVSLALLLMRPLTPMGSLYFLSRRPGSCLSSSPWLFRMNAVKYDIWYQYSKARD